MIESPLTRDFKLTYSEWAYIAGFIDADGSFGIGRYKTTRGKLCYNGRIVVSGTDLLTIRMFYQTFKGTFHSTIPKIKKAKQIYSWRANGQDCLPILKPLIPYLLLKRERAKLLFDFLWYQGALREDRIPLSKSLRNKYLRERDTRLKQFYKEMKDLNKRGKG